jgi:hypothetical protein
MPRTLALAQTRTTSASGKNLVVAWFSDSRGWGLSVILFRE